MFHIFVMKCVLQEIKIVVVLDYAKNYTGIFQFYIFFQKFY